ncbi:MAG: hypothetical protein ABIT36_02345 [Steroidobacteraceae bacterium]
MENSFALLAVLVAFPSTALQPKLIAPAHSELGDRSLIAEQRAHLLALQARAFALRGECKSAVEAGATVGAEFARKYHGWSERGNVAPSVQKAYADTT